MRTQAMRGAYERLILGRPRWVLATLLAVLAAGAAWIPHFRLDASADSLLLEDDRDLRLFREVRERYATEDFLFVTFTPHDALLADASLAVIRALRDEFVQLEAVSSVISLVDVPLVKQVKGGLADIARNARTLEDDDVARNRAREELLRSPIYRDLIISADGRSTALQINIKAQPRFDALLAARTRLREKRGQGGLSPQETQRLAEVVREYTLEKEALDRKLSDTVARARAIIAPWREHGQLHLGGMPMVVDDMITFIKRDLTVFGLGIFLFLVGMLSFLFRRPRWVILPLCSCLYAGIVMIGFLGLMGWKVTVISSNFISLMLIITMSMNIHLIVRYRQLHRDFPALTQRALVSQTISKMVWPCLYTALTTIIAFSSLVFSDIKPVIDFGRMMSIGLCVTFLTTFLLFPCLLLLLARGAPETAGHRQGFHFTGKLATLTERHGGKIFLLTALLALVSALGISRLEVENSFINYFSDKTEIYRGLKMIDEQLGGTTPLDITLDLSVAPAAGANQSEEDDFLALFGEETNDVAWLTPDRLDTIKAVHDHMDSLPAIGKVLSLASVIRVGEDINQAEFDALELAILSQHIPDALRESMFDPYISEQDDEARISMRVLDSLPELRRKELVEQIRSGLVEKLGLAPDRFQVSGMLILYNNMLQSLFQSQIQTLGVVMAGIALTLLVLFRSLSLALIGIIPNLLAAAIILGLMGLAGIPLDMMTITIAAITIGIAVDNSIHYIYRFREELPRLKNYTSTMHYCHANIGKAVFYTAATIIVGFSILVLSNFIPTIYFGVLTALAMLIALLAALTLLPRLLLLWKPFNPS